VSTSESAIVYSNPLRLLYAMGDRIHRSKKIYAITTAVSHTRDERTTIREVISAFRATPGLLRTDGETLLFHEGDGALLHRIQGIRQRAPPIHSVREIVTHIGVDLVDGWPPLEIDIHLR
jgi:hypothetical protein